MPWVLKIPPQGRITCILGIYLCTTLLLVSNVFPLCMNPGDCFREGCNDTMAVAPDICYNHFEEMGCFRVCKDPAELLQCFEAHEPNGTEQFCVLKYSRSLLSVRKPNQASTGGIYAYQEEFTHHPGVPCSLKCRVDPVLWSCVHRCDVRGCFSSFRACLNKTVTVEKNNETVTVIACNETIKNYINQEECKNCFVNETLKELMEEHVECQIRYSTLDVGGANATIAAKLSGLPVCTFGKGSMLNEDNSTGAYQDVNFCIDDLLQASIGPHTADDVANCYKSKVMHRQMELCLSQDYTTQCDGPGAKKTARCQDQCLHVLTKPFCYVPCPRNRELGKCKDNCMIKWPSLECSCGADRNLQGITTFMTEPDKRLQEYRNRIAVCGADVFSCFFEAIHDEIRPSKGNTPLPEWTPEAVKSRNCKSRRHINQFAEQLFASYKNKVAFDNGTMAFFVDHFTYRECYITDCRIRSESDAQHCMHSCVTKKRSNEEMAYVCGGGSGTPPNNPTAQLMLGNENFFRAEIVLWCMISLTSGNEGIKIWGYHQYLYETENYLSYMALYDCEKAIREDLPNPLAPKPSDFVELAKIHYEIESKWCSDCVESTKDPDDDLYHPDDLLHAKCELDDCYRKKLPETCMPLTSLDAIVRPATYASCFWHMDYSLSPEPYRIWSTYFDEVPPHDESHNMIHPNTVKYLLKSSIGFGRGHYVFPYFLVIRPYCEDGYYDDIVYKFIASGGIPVVKIKYFPTTSRQIYVDLMNAVFEGALINLDRSRKIDKYYIPQNPLNRPNKLTGAYDGKTGCHLNLCYPAFLVPQVLLHIPIFEVQVSSQQTINSAHTYGYTTTLHLRQISGRGALKVGDTQDPPTAREFFPPRKAQLYEDTQFIHLWARLPDSGYDESSGGPAGPELEHLLDHNCRPYTDDRYEIGGNPWSPLDTEDFFQLHYTHGNAPQAFFAGFYDPNLVIVGDPDMKRYELVRWNFESSGGSKENPYPKLFHAGYPCFSQNFKVRGYAKPMYSLFDRLDPDYWIEFYRMRYAPKNYRDVRESKAIFKAITLEDRVLFVTTSGLVTFYQNFNTTSDLGKAWQVEKEDRLKRCFKIVRTANRAHPKGDTIVAITYDYQVREKRFDKVTRKPVRDRKGHFIYDISDVSQQVWVGTYQGKADPIVWQELTSGLTSENLKEERVFNVGGDKVGHTGPLPKQKLIGVPVERRETNPKSQIEAICYKTYRSNMGKASYIELIEDQGWCDAIDATPVIAVDQKIQVLVRMKIYYSGGTKSYGQKAKRRTLYIYVVASFVTDTSASQASIWQIDAIIPRIPCQDEHRESIPSVVQYNSKYFREGTPDSVRDKYGCHTEKENMDLSNQIYLHGMTYTRSYNHHLFLYGNKLLQSTDGGQTFVQLESFPEKGADYLCEKSRSVYHRIKVMAFDDLGHYAFLTSKRELWYGNLGSLMQIRLRPSKAHSMVQSRLPEVPELTEAVPFSVFFDSSNSLLEMVAVVDANGTVARIGRRFVNEKGILRARHYLGKLQAVTDSLFERLMAHKQRAEESGDPRDRVFDDELLKEVTYTPLDWSVFCPYASPAFYHNYSEKHGRILNFFFSAPRQHLELGKVNTKATLYTYQAVTFNLIWNSFFHHPVRSYSYVETDPFKLWSSSKTDVSVLGRLTYLNEEPREHGILVTPEKYRRFKSSASESTRIFDTYYLDYNVRVMFSIEFSISNDYTFNSIDYLHHHLDSILLNVDNANGSLIQIDTEKDVKADRAAVRYVIIISVRKNTGIAQSYPGRGGIQVPIKLHLIGGFGTCIPTDSTGVYGDSVATVIHVGCPPSIDLVFDWYSTLHSIRFRDLKAHYGKASKECYNGEQFCFFARYPFIPHFHVFDTAKQSHYNFSGRYIMRIIAGGYSRETMKDYTPEEQQSFNVPGVSDVSLIWNEWDIKYHQKVQRSESYVTTSGRNDSREVVLAAGVSAIQWGCHTLSPCARITPRRKLETVYYFKVFVTNRGVDNNTLCMFEKEFIILLYGFPPSPEIQLVTSVVSYLCILLVLYIAYLCLRGHKKLWRGTTLKLYGWFQVIKETLPSSWFKSSEVNEEDTELEAQRRRDDIILSLQGHLNVPRLIPKETKRKRKTVAAPMQTPAGSEAENEEESKVKVEDSTSKLAVPLATQSSVSSLSTQSEGSETNVIPPLSARPGAITWTDLIYEQIISRRLAAILEKNRQKAEELKAKAESKKLL